MFNGCGAGLNLKMNLSKGQKREIQIMFILKTIYVKILMQMTFSYLTNFYLNNMQVKFNFLCYLVPLF